MSEATINPRITHLALKVDDIEGARKFYEEVFGLRFVSSRHERDHLSVHLTDGHIDLALVKFDSSTTESSRAAGEGPCIHHFGIDVEREQMSAFEQAIAVRGGVFINDPGATTRKFRLPFGGGIGEIAPFGWHSRKAALKS